jgi:hypothetical protein
LLAESGEGDGEDGRRNLVLLAGSLDGGSSASNTRGQRRRRERKRRSVDALLLLKLLLSSGELLLVQRKDSLLDRLRLLLEQRTERLLVNRRDVTLDNLHLLKRLTNNHLVLRLVRVNSQVVRRSVSATNALDPAVGGVDLGVPAVGGVVSHLVRHVLAETEAVGVDTDLGEEEEDASNEVTESLVVDHALREKER